MGNTFSQIHLHIVFAVKYRDAMLADDWRDELFRYISGIIKNNGQTPIAIGGFRDHVHILMGCTTTANVAKVVKDIKLATNKWIQPRYRCRFAWQDGYAVFSLSKSHESAVREYIMHQPEHHSRVSMRDEFIRLLSVNGVAYDSRYIPHTPE